MNLTHDTENKTAKLSLTQEELNNLVANYFKQKIQPLMVDTMKNIINHRTQGDPSRCKEATGMSFEHMTSEQLLSEQVMQPAIKALMSSYIQTAIEQSANRYVNTLIMVQRNGIYDRLFNDSIINPKNTDDKAVKIFAFNRARHTTFMIDVLDDCITHEMQKSGASYDELKDINAKEQFCEKTYGHRLSTMTDPHKRGYILVHASESAMMYTQKRIPMNPRAIMALTLNIRKDPYVKNNMDNMKKAHIAQMTLIQYIAESAYNNMPEHKIESLTKELFGCSLVEAFNPDNPNYIMSMCKTGDKTKMHPSQAKSLDELISLTITKHARKGANLNLLNKTTK